MSGRTTQAISERYRKNPWGASTALHPLELSHKGHHEKSYGSLRPSKRLIRERTETKRTGSQRMKSGRYLHHGPITVRWLYLTFCQLRIGSCQESSRIHIYAIWPALLMGCQHWVL